jgi:hypothetical protein
MCIIADQVKDVTSTSIAVFHVGYMLGTDKTDKTDKTTTPTPAQLVVYSAQVESMVDRNAFILPVYNPSRRPEMIIPVDMSKLNDFFFRLELIFQKWFPSKQKGNWAHTNSFGLGSDNVLPVHKVGNYKFSIMPNKKDFERINQSQLNIDPMAKVSIDMHSDDYSFIVYQFFKKGKVDIEPFGYLCEASSPNSMVVPTIHGHPHNQMLGFDMGSVHTFVHYESKFEQLATYDHLIYALVKCPEDHAKIKLDQSDLKSVNNILKQITKDYQGRAIRLLAPKCLIPKKLEIKTIEANRNLWIDLDGSRFVYDLVVDMDRGYG